MKSSVLTQVYIAFRRIKFKQTLVFAFHYKHLKGGNMQRLSPNVAEAVGIHVDRPNFWQRFYVFLMCSACKMYSFVGQLA